MDSTEKDTAATTKNCDSSQQQLLPASELAGKVVVVSTAERFREIIDTETNTVSKLELSASC
jgi:hypothetical protein